MKLREWIDLVESLLNELEAHGIEFDDEQTAVSLPLLRGTTDQHKDILTRFTEQSGLGRLIPHPKFSDRMIFIPSKPTYGNDIERVEQQYLEAVRRRFNMMPFKADQTKHILAPRV